MTVIKDRRVFLRTHACAKKKNSAIKIHASTRVNSRDLLTQLLNRESNRTPNFVKPRMERERTSFSYRRNIRLHSSALSAYSKSQSSETFQLPPRDLLAFLYEDERTEIESNDCRRWKGKNERSGAVFAISRVQKPKARRLRRRFQEPTLFEEKSFR